MKKLREFHWKNMRKLIEIETQKNKYNKRKETKIQDQQLLERKLSLY